MWRLGPHVATKLRATRRRRHIILPDTYERIRADHLLRLRRQSIKPIEQINRMAGEKDLRARRQTDHSVLRIARKTRDSAFSFTSPSTQMRTPFGNAISIVPDPPSILG